MSDYPKKTTLSPVATRSFSIIGEEKESEQGGKSSTMQSETKRKWSVVSEHGERIAADVGGTPVGTDIGAEMRAEIATNVGRTDVKESKRSLRLVSPVDSEPKPVDSGTKTVDSGLKPVDMGLEMGEDADFSESIDEEGLEDWEMETKILEPKMTSPHLTFYSQNRDVYTQDGLKFPTSNTQSLTAQDVGDKTKRPSRSASLYTQDTCTSFSSVSSSNPESAVAEVSSELLLEEGITGLLTQNRAFDSKAAAKRLEMIYTSKTEAVEREPKKPTAAFRSMNEGFEHPSTVDVPQELFQSSTLLSEETVQESIRLVSEEHLAPPPPHFTPIWGKQRTQRTGWAKTQPVELVAKKTAGQSACAVSTFSGKMGAVIERRKNSGEKGLDELLGSWSQLSEQQKDEIRAIVQR
ncbi:MAG: hypothetical protein ACRC10_00470 [Thermoguttaceae bacterium]